MVAQNMWHVPPNSTPDHPKYNHRSGRYAVWGVYRQGRQVWDVVDGQGPQGKPLGRICDTAEGAMREAERIIQENERSTRGTGVGHV